MDAIPEEATSTCAVMTAAMLIKVCGSRAQGRQLAAGWTRKSTARSAQMVYTRNASAA
jgi:hypothetical protein